ncbi:hypothetical protein ACQ86D_14555 [Streptomyces galilaeus]
MITKPMSHGHAATIPVLGGVHPLCTAPCRVERRRRSEAVFASLVTVPGVWPGSSAGRVLTWPHQFLTDLTLHATTLTLGIAMLIRDTGPGTDIDERAQVLHAGIETAGLTSLLPLLELAVCFHQAVRGDEEPLAAAIHRLRRITNDGDHAYLADIACFMDNRPITPGGHPVRWLENEETIRRRWRGFVTDRFGP